MSDLGSRLRTTLQTFPWVTMGFPLGLRPLLPSHLVRKWGGGKPPVWGLLLIWDYPLPSLMEVIHRGNTDPALDQIIKTEISRKVLSPSLISRFYHLFMEPSPPGTRRGGGCSSATPISPPISYIPGSYFSNIPPMSAKGFSFVR